MSASIGLEEGVIMLNKALLLEDEKETTELPAWRQASRSALLMASIATTPTPREELEDAGTVSGMQTDEYGEWCVPDPSDKSLVVFRTTDNIRICVRGSVAVSRSQHVKDLVSKLSTWGPTGMLALTPSHFSPLVYWTCLFMLLRSQLSQKVAHLDSVNPNWETIIPLGIQLELGSAAKLYRVT
jgi:hypothetical protein